MYNRIITSVKQLADKAIALQNKDRMDATLREISALCDLTHGLKEPEVLASAQPDLAAKPADDGIIRSATNPIRTIVSTNESTAAMADDFSAKLAAAKPGDTMHITGTENTETGESKVLSVKVTPPAAKPAKKGAK